MSGWTASAPDMSLLDGYVDRVLHTNSTAFVLGSLSVVARTDRAVYRALIQALQLAIRDAESHGRNYTDGTIRHNRPTDSGP